MLLVYCFANNAYTFMWHAPWESFTQNSWHSNFDLSAEIKIVLRYPPIGVVFFKSAGQGFVLCLIRLISRISGGSFALNHDGFHDFLNLLRWQSIKMPDDKDEGAQLGSQKRHFVDFGKANVKQRANYEKV